MKHLTLIFSICIAAVFCCSCSLDEVLYYSDNAIGEINNGTIITDDGLTYRIVENICPENLPTEGRIVVLSDVLTKTSDTSYDIRLKNFSTVDVKETLKSSDYPDKTELGHDAIGIEKAWTSGGYLNLLLDITVLRNSETKHLVNLVYDNIGSNSDTLKFTLLHNGYGETLEDKGDLNTGVYSFYSSFPIDKFFPDGKKEVALIINWKWYKDDGAYLLRELEEKTSKGTYQKK